MISQIDSWIEKKQAIEDNKGVLRGNNQITHTACIAFQGKSKIKFIIFNP